MPTRHTLSILLLRIKKDDMVTIDTASIDGPNSAGYFNTDQIVDTLNGSLKNPSEIKKLSYTVRDAKENIVLSSDIDIAADWSVKNFGLVIGFNSIVVTAIDKNGIEYNEGVSVFNNNHENMNRTNVDTNDDDEDGFCNYYETILGTDPKKQDTDEDGFTDDKELELGTDCSYDPTTKLYSYEYTYMLIDYYDFPLLESFNEMNVIGVAQTFELIGYLYGTGVGSKNGVIILV